MVIPGAGKTGWNTASQPAMPHWANNDGWFDDASDGPVSATVTLAGGQVLHRRVGEGRSRDRPSIAGPARPADHTLNGSRQRALEGATMHTSHGIRAALCITILAGAFAATTASAEERAINASAVIDADGLMTVYAVGPTPKGLFTIGNKLVRNKGVLTVSYIIAESECNAAVTGSVSSATTGTFIPYLNPTGQTVAYGWNTTVDLSVQQNHWHNFIRCNGAVEVVGCQGDRAVSLNFTLTTPGGAD